MERWDEPGQRPIYMKRQEKTKEANPEGQKPYGEEIDFVSSVERCHKLPSTFARGLCYLNHI